jgi:hypothetical protein
MEVSIVFFSAEVSQIFVLQLGRSLESGDESLADDKPRDDQKLCWLETLTQRDLL